ncbi:hypothetical protein ACHAXR_004718 [Thalassiosira sp. AJA248-18]
MNNNNSRSQQQQQQQQQQAARLARIQQHRQKLLLEQLQQRKAEYTSSYNLPLNYPAKVIVVAAAAAATDDDVVTNDNDAQRRINNRRTSSDFVNARLLEAGLPLGGTPSSSSGDSNDSSGDDGARLSSSSSSLAQHIVSTQRFIRDLEGTGCYDAVQIHIGNSHDDGDGQKAAATSQQSAAAAANNVTVQLQEKKWYKLYIGGGVNSDDLSSLGGTTTSSSSNASSSLGSSLSGVGTATGLLPKLQFETSASLLNLTGFCDISSASYLVDQTGSSSFRFVHDRPLVSYLSRRGALYDWLMPQDPRTVANEDDNGDGNNVSTLEEGDVYINDDSQYSMGGGSHTSLGLHATFHDVDCESTRSTKEFVRSVGLRLANHARGGGGSHYKPSTSPPEGMAGPYLFLDWNATLRDVLPKRSQTHPFALDCSPEIAQQAGTYLKHSILTGLCMNGCFVDDRYDPTMGYDAHVVGEVAGPPGDVGYWKVKGGYSWHVPVELLRMMVVGVNDIDNNEEYNDDNGGKEGEDSPSVIGMALHSSFNCGLIRPLTFNGLLGNHNNASCCPLVPSSDRFYIGGPGQLRGFLPAGIGPRANKGGSSVPGGDALGGDLFYTSTLATSIPFPSYFSKLRHNGARIFGFANAGTCVSTGLGVHGASLSLLDMPVWGQILQSTRVSLGGGVSVGSPMGRFEATYAVPVRYGPRDARKSVQFGFGFSFG